MAKDGISLDIAESLPKLMKQIVKEAQGRRRTFFNNASIIAHRNVVKHFREEMGPRARWKRLKKPRKGGGKILQDTGVLLGSIIPRSSPDEALVETDIAYAGVHNFGFRGSQSVPSHSRRSATGLTTVKSHTRETNIPKREFMYLDEDGIRRIEKLLQRIILPD